MWGRPVGVTVAQDGSILERAPVRVVLAFSDAVATNFTSIQLVEAKTGVNYPPNAAPGPSISSKPPRSRAVCRRTAMPAPIPRAVILW